MRFFVAALVLCLLVPSTASAQGGALIDPHSEEKAESYAKIYDMLITNSKDINDAGSYITMILSVVTALPPEDRQKLVSDSALAIQNAPQQQRLQSLEMVAAMWRTVEPVQQQALMQHMTLATRTMTAVERQIVALQLSKLSGDLALIPIEDRRVVGTLLEHIISETSQQPHGE